MAYPALRRVINQSFGDISIDQTGQIGIPNSVQRQFDQVESGLNRDFDIAERGAQVYTTQNFKQAGNPYSQAQLDYTNQTQQRALEQMRSQAMTNLQFQEAQAGLGQFNTLMNLISGGSGAALNLAGGFGNASNGALQFLPQTSREGGAFSGAIAGAGTGAALGPWGAIGGAILGGFGGYMSAG